jgi:hypothetical protein
MNWAAASLETTCQTETSVFGTKLPNTLGGFERGATTNNEPTSSGMGCTIRYYSASSGKATVFVYNKCIMLIPNGPMDPLIRREFDQASRDILRSSQYSHRTFELIEQYATGSPGDGPEFLCSEFLERSSSSTVRTFLYVTGARGSFVKLRVTLTTDDPRDSTARDFADSIATILRSRTKAVN